MTKDEISVLLYFETCLVDRRGGFSSAQMNKEDFAIAKKWRKEGFIDFGRIPAKDLRRQRVGSPFRTSTNWVVFTAEAWRLAHRARQAKAEKYSTTILSKQLPILSKQL